MLSIAFRAVLDGDVSQVQSPPTDPGRVAVMQHHFIAISRVQDAVIRGDLKAALAPAAELAAMRMPAGLPEAVDPVVRILRQAGRVVGTTRNLRTVAAATVTMLQQCATCHRMVGVYPTPVPAKRPDVGGIVGHMLDHLRATDDLLQGLVIPSESLWQSGADRLRGTALDPRDWPRDRKLTAEARNADEAVHSLAGRARTAKTANARGAVYAELITTCASCHSLHRNVWGPRSKR